MNTLIFRTIAPLITIVMVAFSLFIVLRGHNAPGGGFIGGLIAASGLAIYGLASGREAVRRALRAAPLAYAGAGVALAALSGVLSAPFGLPFLTGLWETYYAAEGPVQVSTPMLFDIGVYLAVFGAITAIVLELDDEGADG